MPAYRARLAQIQQRLGPRPSDADRWTSSHSHDWLSLDWNARRLAVLDRDIEAIIRTHARDRRVAAWLQDTAEAFEQIGEIDLSIDWAKQAAHLDRGHQALEAADYWCRLLDPKVADEVMATLARQPNDAVLFALTTLRDTHLAWKLAHELGLDSDHTWAELAKAHQKVDPIGVLPIHHRLVELELVHTGAQHYRLAARRLATMRGLAADTEQEAHVDDLIAELRQTHRRRPRLQQEFDRAGLP